MKLKGINTFEQHIEKIVLGVAILGVVGIAAWQFISAPTVPLGKQTVSPGEVDALLQRKAEGLQTRLRGESDIKIPAEGVPLAAPTFGDRLARHVSPAPSLARTSPSFNGMLVKNNATSADVWYHEPTVKQVQMLAVHETADALTAEAAKAAAKVSPVVAARFGTIDGPADIVWTTPVARLDLKAIREELARAEKEANPPRQAIPGVWYQETPFVVDVLFERRAKKADGTWGEPQEVPVFSSRIEELTYRPRIKDAKGELKDEVFSVLGVPEQQLDVLQLPFYDTVNGAFVSPSVLLAQGTAEADPSADAGALRRRLQAQTQMEQKQRKATVIRDELTKLGGPWDAEQEKKRLEEERASERERKEAEKGSGTKGGGGLTGGGGGGLGGSMTKDPNKGAKPVDERTKRIRRIAKTTELKKLEAELAELEKLLGAAPVAAGPKPKVPGIATLDEILVWGHDLEVEPGKTYQYRCVARVLNPFFSKGNMLVQEQAVKGLDKPFTTDSLASAWSAETTVSPSVRFFVTRAMVGDGSLQAGTAQVEIYRLMDGQWRRSEMTVQPGERIGRKDTRGASAEVDFSTDYFLVDVVEDLDAKASGNKSERRPGFAVVRAMSTEDMDVRSPVGDLDDPDRLKLRAQADAAASAKPDAKDAKDAKDGKGDGTRGPGGSGGNGAPPRGPGGPGGPGGGGATGGR